MRVKELTNEVKSLKETVKSLQEEANLQNEKLETQEKAAKEAEAEAGRQETLLIEAKMKLDKEIGMRETAEAQIKVLEVIHAS